MTVLFKKLNSVLTMASFALFILGLLAYAQNGECAISWTIPSGGTGTLATAVPETNTVGDLASAIITATTDGAGPASITSYPVVSPAGMFTVTAGTGQIVLVTGFGLDYETSSTIVMIVEAIDDDTAGAVTSTATVTITITDVTTDPVFAALSFCVVMPDLTAASTTVTTIAATDSDTTTLTLAMIDGNTGTDFAISATGVVTVLNSLDRVRTGTYVMKATATDTTLSGTTTLTVCVGTSTQCAGCGTSTTQCNGAKSIASSISMLLALVFLMIHI